MSTENVPDHPQFCCASTGYVHCPATDSANIKYVLTAWNNMTPTTILMTSTSSDWLSCLIYSVHLCYGKAMNIRLLTSVKYDTLYKYFSETHT